MYWHVRESANDSTIHDACFDKMKIECNFTLIRLKRMCIWYMPQMTHLITWLNWHLRRQRLVTMPKRGGQAERRLPTL